MRRRRLHILIALLVLAFCRLLRDSSVAPATAEVVAQTEEYPTTAPATIVKELDQKPTWDWLFVRNAPTIDSASDGTGQSSQLAGFVMPTIHVFPSPDWQGAWNQTHAIDGALGRVGGLFDDHFKTPQNPWIDPPISPTPHGDDVPVTPAVSQVPPPALAISSDPPTFGEPPAAIVIPPRPPVGGPSSLPPLPGPASAPVPEPNGIILPILVLLLARRFPARA